MSEETTIQKDRQEVLEAIDLRIQDLRDEAQQWEMVREAYEEATSPLRERMVVYFAGDYYSTYRWEINPNNGFVTVQLKDGSILPTQLGAWCRDSYATDYFGIDRTLIKVDDPDRG